jgi:hypothetical protein
LIGPQALRQGEGHLNEHPPLACAELLGNHELPSLRDVK